MAGKLSWRERIAYTIGGLGLQTVYMFITTYFQAFMTDTLGIGAGAAGIILVIARIWDGINDPMCGVLADKTRTRWGSYRPWVVGGVIPAAVFGVLCFFSPNAGVTAKIIYIAIVYICFGMSFTAFDMPFGCLANTMTEDYDERGLLGVLREIGSNAGQLVAAQVGGAILGAICGVGAYTSGAYMAAAAVLGAIMVVSLVFCVINCKERVPNQGDPISFKMAFKGLFSNKHALQLGVIVFMFILFLAFHMGWVYYYAVWYLGNPMLIAPLITCVTAPAIVVLFFTAKIMQALGKKNTIILGGAILILAGILFLIGGTSVTMAYAASIVAGIGQSFPLAAVWACIPDAADVGEAATGIRCPGMLFTYTSFMLKVAGALCGGLASLFLVIFGYDGMAAAQTASCVQGIYWVNGLMVAIPGLLIILCTLPYKLDRKAVQEATAKLRAAREKAQK